DRWTFRRGFVDEVVIRNPPRPLTAERFDEVFAFPFVRRVTAEGQGWRLFPGLVEAEGARGLEELRIWGGGWKNPLEPRQFRALVGCPRFERVRRLTLHACELSASDVARLEGSELFGRLTALDLSGNPFGDEGIAALTRSPRIGRLKYLDLSACDAHGDSALALASAPLLAGLTSLRLSDNRLAGHVSALFRCPHLAGLTELDLAANWLDETLSESNPDEWGGLFDADGP